MAGEVSNDAAGSGIVARLFVAGRPRTKGHIQTNAHGAGRDREVLRVWMSVMTRSIKKQLGIRLGLKGGKVVRIDAEPYAGPVEVHCFFRFERETCVQVRDGAQVPWPSHDTPWPTALDIGDEDTLRRAVLDALTKTGVIADDRLSVGGPNNWKRWCEPGERAGVLIVVRAAPEPAEVLRREQEAMNW